jgi:hypothetical protein
MPGLRAGHTAEAGEGGLRGLGRASQPASPHGAAMKHRQALAFRVAEHPARVLPLAEASHGARR